MIKNMSGSNKLYERKYCMRGSIVPTRSLSSITTKMSGRVAQTSLMLTVEYLELSTCAALDLSGLHVLSNMLFYSGMTFQWQLGDVHGVAWLLQRYPSAAQLCSITCGLSDHLCSKAAVEGLCLYQKQGQPSIGQLQCIRPNVGKIGFSTTAASNVGFCNE